MNPKKVLIITKSFIKKPLVQNNNRKFFQYNKEKASFVWKQGLMLKNIVSNYFEQVDLMSYKEIEESLAEKHKIDEIKKYNYIISVGGDGTFLTCGHIIDNSTQILLGINSNPLKSEGFLCQIPYNTAKITKTLDKITTNNFKILKRKRYTIDLFNKQNEKKVHFFGLNEVFFGSKDNSSTFRYDFKVNGDSMDHLRSTGCILYTGTGSTGWAKSMKKMTKTHVEEVLGLYREGVRREDVERVTALYNKKLEMHPEYGKMRFLHREMFNRISKHRHEGEGSDFEIVNRTMNGFLAFDGYYYGMEMEDRAEVKMSDASMDLSCFCFD